MPNFQCNDSDLLDLATQAITVSGRAIEKLIRRTPHPVAHRLGYADAPARAGEAVQRENWPDARDFRLWRANSTASIVVVEFQRSGVWLCERLRVIQLAA